MIHRYQLGWKFETPKLNPIGEPIQNSILHYVCQDFQKLN